MTPKTTADEFDAWLRRFGEPGDMLAPLTSEAAAKLLGIAAGSLRNLRLDNMGPPGWAKVPGVGWRYRSKLDVLRWFWEQHELASTERRAA